MVRIQLPQYGENSLVRQQHLLDIDEHGLDEMDKRILETIVHKFSGGPVGISSMAVAVGGVGATVNVPILVENIPVGDK